MGGPRKNKKIEVETKVKETIVETPKVETNDALAAENMYNKPEFIDGEWVVTPKSILPLVPLVPLSKEMIGDAEQTTSMTVKEEVVIPIVVKSGHIQTGDKVKLVNATTNKVIAAAVNRRLAEKLIKSNPSLKIV